MFSPRIARGAERNRKRIDALAPDAGVGDYPRPRCGGGPAREGASPWSSAQPLEHVGVLERDAHLVVAQKLDAVDERLERLAGELLTLKSPGELERALRVDDRGGPPLGCDLHALDRAPDRRLLRVHGGLQRGELLGAPLPRPVRLVGPHLPHRQPPQRRAQLSDPLRRRLRRLDRIGEPEEQVDMGSHDRRDGLLEDVQGDGGGFLEAPAIRRVASGPPPPSCPERNRFPAMGAEHEPREKVPEGLYRSPAVGVGHRALRAGPIGRVHYGLVGVLEHEPLLRLRLARGAEADLVPPRLAEDERPFVVGVPHDLLHHRAGPALVRLRLPFVPLAPQHLEVVGGDRALLVELRGDLRLVEAVERQLEDPPDDRGALLVRRAGVLAFPLPVGERHRAEVHSPGVLAPDALRDLAREVLRVPGIHDRLESQLHSRRGALAVPPGVVVVHHRDHAHAQRGQLVLDQADAVEVVAAEPGQVLDDDRADAPLAATAQHLLQSRPVLGMRAADPVVDEEAVLLVFEVVAGRDEVGEDQPLVRDGFRFSPVAVGDREPAIERDHDSASSICPILP